MSKDLTATQLQTIKNMSKKEGKSNTTIAKELKLGYRAVKTALKAKNIGDYRRLIEAENKKEAAASKKNRAAKRNNAAQVEKAADKIKEPVYTDRQATAHINQLIKHVANLEDRVQTLSSLLVESDDNLVTRIYKLENKRGLVRRFLERF